ncbi:hypothetical protein HQO42_18545 [Rhodococcus fascians]|nr:hypothetical protein [Rhodococcus fascians]MBY4238755.1 hypothetical protein [Rhodococcus fascians]MBY4254656.1 hypothetical protein [Rhodococcus fascians]MBY4270110.1 hypothetical protein [Rhodococcus fascians]
MFNVLAEINWFAVIAFTIVFAVLGGLYFTAIVAKPYKVALGNETRELPKPGTLFIVGPPPRASSSSSPRRSSCAPSMSPPSATGSFSDSSSASATSSPRR